MHDNRRTRLVLGVLLIVAIALITLDFRDGGSSPARGVGADIFGPIERVTHDVTDPISSLFDSVTGGPSAQNTIANLQQENAALRAQLSSARLSKTARQQLEQLHAIAPTVGQRRRLLVGRQQPRRRRRRSEQRQHRQVDLAVPAIRRRVDQPRTPVRVGHHVARPQIAVQPRRRLTWTRELLQAPTHALHGRRPPGRQRATFARRPRQRALTGTTDWEAVALLYGELVRLSPALGAFVGHAAALANARGPRLGLAALDAIDSRSVLNYQPYWAVRAHLLSGLGDTQGALDAYSQAIGLSEDPKVRDFLIRSRDRLSGG